MLPRVLSPGLLGYHHQLRPSHLVRYLSQQTDLKPTSDQPKASTTPTTTTTTSKAVNKNEYIGTHVIPKDASDNFLITFHDRKPTYDQLFEYKIGEEVYNKTRFTDQSYLSANVKIALFRNYDISLAGFQRWLRRYIYKDEVTKQMYRNRRHGILGPDLATSHFVVARGGKARFINQPDVWVTNHKNLPNTFDKNYKLISLDASKLGLIYEGLDNLILLPFLQELSLAGNPKLDDWACDKLARIFRNSTTLEHLDLSDMPLITHRGIEAMHKIRSLKTLVIKGTRAAQFPFIELLSIMMKDLNPQCQIVYK